MEEVEEKVALREELIAEELKVDGVPVVEVIEKEVEVEVEVEIEGKVHRWTKETITAEEIAGLGGWAVSQGVLHIDAENNERTLSVDEVVRIEVGVVFAKKIRFRRG